MNIPQSVQLEDAETALRVEGDNAIFRRTQNISSHFLADLADKRFDSRNSPVGDLHHVASLPTVVVEKWMAEGFNIFDKNITLPEILKRLQREDMERLFATSKNIR